MSIYATGVEAYRDTTRWIAAFVPITALASAGFLLGDRLLQRSGTGGALELGVSGWVLLALLIAVAAVVAILWAAARVLSVEGEEVTQLTEGGSTEVPLASAFGAGAALPYFFVQDDYNAMMAKRNAHEPLTDAELTALNEATTAIRDWSIFRKVKDAFTVFVKVFAVASTVLGLAGMAALIALRSGPPVEAPTAVTVTLSETGRAALLDATGCTDPAGTSFVALGGTWTDPMLDPSGPGCRFGVSWNPEPAQADVAYAVGS